MLARTRRLVGVRGSVRRSRAAATGGGPEAVRRRSSSTAAPRATRSTATSRSGRTASRARQRRRSSRRSPRRPSATRELWRYLFDIDWARAIRRVAAPARPPALPPARRRRGGCGSASATASGCGSSTSARRSRRARYAADGAVVFDVVDEFCPWNEGRWRLADGVAKRSTSLGRSFACDVGGARLRLPRRLHVRPARARRPRRGAAARRRRARGRDVPRRSRAPWCPEIF